MTTERSTYALYYVFRDNDQKLNLLAILYLHLPTLNGNTLLNCYNGTTTWLWHHYSEFDPDYDSLSIYHYDLEDGKFV